MIFGEEADDHSPILSFRRSRNLLVNPESNLAYGTSDIRYETSLKPIALLASKVCQHWCNIAESNGTLYSTDVIWVDRRNPYIKKSTKAFLGHLDATSPSDINISCLFSVSWDHIEENLGSTFSLLLQPLLTDYGHRIVALDVTFANFRGITSFLEAFNCLQLPRLQRFGLRKFEYFADAVVVPRRIIAPPSISYHGPFYRLSFSNRRMGFGVWTQPRCVETELQLEWKTRKPNVDCHCQRPGPLPAAEAPGALHRTLGLPRSLWSFSPAKACRFTNSQVCVVEGP